jgi:hypothetical protein
LIKITKNNWRPFIELTTATEDEATVYFDVSKRPIIIQAKEGTILDFGQEGSVLVKEKAKDIIKAVDRMIEENKKAEAERNEAELAARMALYEQQKAE